MSIFNGLPLMGILRGIRADEVSFAAEIAAREGLQALEVTMNTEEAPKLIRALSDAAAGRFSVGAGTVLSMADLDTALDAGASFIVMPTYIPSVTAACVRKSVPVFPGALTPQEIWTAAEAGAEMVKVFPANLFGPRYFKDLRGPFAKIPLMACGGVTPENLGEFFSCGANSVSFGGSIFKREWLESRNETALTDALRSLIDAYKVRGG